MRGADAANCVQFQPGMTRGHVESFFIKANAPDGERALWLKFTVLAPAGVDAPLFEVWAIRFTRGATPRALKQTFTAANYSRTSVGLEFGPCRFDGLSTSGRLEAGDSYIDWDLALEARAQLLKLYPHDAMYRLPLPKSKALSPLPLAVVSGTVGSEQGDWRLAAWPGMQGHNWGRRHTEEYAWAHCALLDDAGQAVGYFEGLSGRVGVGPLLTPPLSAAAVMLDGELTRFTQLHRMVLHRSRFRPVQWELDMRNAAGDSLQGRIEATPASCAGLHYENPGGEMTYCLNSKLAGMELLLTRAGHRAKHLPSDICALEIGTRDQAHGVPMII